MEKIDIINNIIKMFFILLGTLFVYIKVINYKNITLSKVFMALFFSFILSLFYAFIIVPFNRIIIFPVICIIQSIVMSYITKEKFNYCIVITTISFIMTYVIYLISILLGGNIIWFLMKQEILYKPISLLIIFIVMYSIIYTFFRIKRFKNGFYFLKNYENISHIGIYCILFLGILLLLCILSKFSWQAKDFLLQSYVATGSVIVLIAIIIWIRSEITKKYKENMKDRTIEMQNKELEVQEKTISELKEDNLKLSEIIHKYNNRFNALENSIISTLDSSFSSETSSELSIMLNDLKSISANFSDEVQEIANSSIHLPLTNIRSIDNIFRYMASKAVENNMKFELKINDNILPLINTIITKEDFETLIGDHITDAIIAINSSDNEHRDIMCLLGIIDNCYEFSIYDTGVNFEIETLLNLGLKRITTHKNTGGSGIGFMTTFATLNKCKASLIIEEYISDDSYFTKSIIIRFDDKNEYKIRSYRIDEINAQMKDNRISLEKIN